MIRPSRHDYATKSRFDIPERWANGVAAALFVVCLVLAGVWFYQTFLQTEQAIKHSISLNGGK